MDSIEQIHRTTASMSIANNDNNVDVEVKRAEMACNLQSFQTYLLSVFYIMYFSNWFLWTIPWNLLIFLMIFSLCGLEGLAEKIGRYIFYSTTFGRSFLKHIGDLKQQSVRSKTRTNLLNSTDNVEFIMKGIIDESSLKTQTEFSIIGYQSCKAQVCLTALDAIIKRAFDILETSSNTSIGHGIF
jgi:hypothetical protein